jgi:hypothetical protein
MSASLKAFHFAPFPSNPFGSQQMRLPLLAFVFVVAGAAFAADKLADLQAKFDRENKGVSKAKILEKLGDAQFLAARAAGHQGDYSTSGLTLEKFRDNARACVAALKKQQADAERHPNGFRQAEVILRRGIREVDELILVSPDFYRPPLQQVRSDLIGLDDELLTALFPRRVPPAPAPAPSTATPPPTTDNGAPDPQPPAGSNAPPEKNP